MPPDSVWIAIPHFAANFSTFGYQLGSFEFFSICLSNAFFFDFSRRSCASTDVSAACGDSSRTTSASCDSTL